MDPDEFSYYYVFSLTKALLVQDIATAITALVIAFEANWQFSLIVLVLVPLVLLNGHVQMKSMPGFSTDAKKLYDEVSQVANDAVGNIRTVATFCADKVMELYQKKCVGPIQTSIGQGLVSGTGIFFPHNGSCSNVTIWLHDPSYE
ncbi:ABC transporter B family member 11 [Spatholobus suberectus]|nr:ABC transporter B family member 11 [Spatholobus suberectus]